MGASISYVGARHSRDNKYAVRRLLARCRKRLRRHPNHAYPDDPAESLTRTDHMTLGEYLQVLDDTHNMLRREY